MSRPSKSIPRFPDATQYSGDHSFLLFVSRVSVLSELEATSSADAVFSEVISDFTNYDEIFIIGGSEIYALVLPLAHKLYVTKIDKIYDGDTWFPKIHYNEWKIQESTQITEETTQTQYENIIYTKISE